MKFQLSSNANGYESQIQQLKKNYEIHISQFDNSKVLADHCGPHDPDISGGSVALDENGKVVAWLKVHENVSDYFDDFLSLSVLHDLKLPECGSVIKRLYGIEVDKIDKPYCEHKVLCLEFDGDLLRVWVELGFGIEQAYGYAQLTDLRANLKPNTYLRIEELNKENNNAFREFYSLVAISHAQAPVFAGAPDGYLLALKSGFEGLIDDKNARVLLAFDGDEAVGYQVWSMEDEKVAELAVGGTKADYRGNGIGTTLTAYGVDRAIERGYKYCIADWKTANPLSSSFWQAIGFMPYKYRLVRRFSRTAIDDSKRLHERIT